MPSARPSSRSIGLRPAANASVITSPSGRCTDRRVAAAAVVGCHSIALAVMTSRAACRSASAAEAMRGKNAAAAARTRVRESRCIERMLPPNWLIERELRGMQASRDACREDVCRRNRNIGMEWCAARELRHSVLNVPLTTFSPHSCYPYAVRSRRSVEIATQSLIALAGNAAVTLIGRAVHLNPNTAGFAFLIVVLLSSLRGGLAVGAMASIVATLCYNFFF